MPVAIHHAAALVGRRCSDRRVEREMNWRLCAPVEPLLRRSNHAVAIAENGIEGDVAGTGGRNAHDFEPLLKFVSFRVARLVNRARARLTLRILQRVPSGDAWVCWVFRDIVGIDAAATAADAAGPALPAGGARLGAGDPIVRKISREDAAAG